MREGRHQPLLTPVELRQWTKVSRYRNLLCVAGEYCCLILLHGLNIYLLGNLKDWGQAWIVLPAGLITILLTGFLMHRIGLLGHEASHGLLHPNRKWNDFLADLLCFFPLWSSSSSYRAKHQGHHLHPNDPERDPNLAGHKAEELYAKFPMPRPAFIWNYYCKFFWPPFVLKNLFDLLRVLSVGRVRRSEETGRAGTSGWASRLRNRIVSPVFLAICFLIALGVVTNQLVVRGEAAWLFAGQAACLGLAVLVWMAIPSERFRVTRRESPGSAKGHALFRLFFYSSILMVGGWVRLTTGFNLGLYYLVFWIIPLLYLFPYLMLLREIYQHANLGTDRLGNSRIIHADPFTRWALLGYGNDLHLIHHLYPNIPHYHLKETHECLMDKSRSYRESIVQTSGVFHAPDGETALLASLGSEE